LFHVLKAIIRFCFGKRVCEIISLTGRLWLNFELASLEFKLLFDLLAFDAVPFEKNVLGSLGFSVDIFDYIPQTAQLCLLLIASCLLILICACWEEIGRVLHVLYESFKMGVIDAK